MTADIPSSVSQAGEHHKIIDNKIEGQQPPKVEVVDPKLDEQRAADLREANEYLRHCQQTLNKLVSGDQLHNKSTCEHKQNLNACVMLAAFSGSFAPALL